ncbi:MAG: purine-binding chemotaxis protein CheW [Lachnospiraceae bacterium]|nr:purine-binding chemotaxis protein CheW [Lachnospiraceae bacterium]
MECKQLVVFNVQNERYGINIEQVSAIEKDQNVSRIPNSMDYIKGIINLRGDIIPVFDLKKKFKLESNTKSATAQLIIVKVYDIQIALEVDNVEEIFNVSEGELMPVPKICVTEATEYFVGVIREKGTLIIQMDASKLFTKEEIERLTEVINM